ncbi:MAG TPA: DUF222 domain-containing protein [Actinomycetes bacterium]|nr:DUF222 domain-containing protein [Actinomycetes bacterium]
MCSSDHPPAAWDAALEVAASLSAYVERGVLELDDDELRDHVVTMNRLANMAQASVAQGMVEMARRAEQADATESAVRQRPLHPHERRWDFIADEVAILLSITKPDASRRHGLALAASEHPAVVSAWQKGDIDARKVEAICEAVDGMSEPAKSTVVDGAVVYATSHTISHLRRWLLRRVLAADPSMAEVRRKRSYADRSVLLTPLANGLSELAALLPSVQARQLYDTINAVAHQADPDDQRTMNQRRADAMVDLVTGRAAPPRVQVQVVVSADTLLGKADIPGEVLGVGPITGAEALGWAGPAPTGGYERIFSRLLTDPSTGYLVDISEKKYRPSLALDRAVRARDVVCRFPGCSRPASSVRSGTDLDHTIPWPDGETSASNLAVLCRHHHLLKHSPGWAVEQRDDRSMVWTTPTGKTFVTEPWVYAEPP